jgi:ubiquinone/menaquinone biosynthesis C-methylase UbiE
MSEADAMSDAMTGQVSPEAAELYERFFVPALFDQWPSRLLDLAGAGVGDDVLDIACGTGVLARAAKSRVGPTGSVCGVDVNAGMLSVAARVEPGVSWVPGRAESLPMPDNSFNRVCCQFGLMFFSDRQAAVEEMARVVRAGGSVCVATWAALSETAGYAAMVELLDDLFGPEPAKALAAPYSIGTPSALYDAISTGFDEVEVCRLEGMARFPSIDAWVSTDVHAWTLRDMLDNDQFAELCAQTRIRLREFCDPSGLVTFPSPALVAVVRP